MLFHGILMLVIGTLELALGVYLFVRRASGPGIVWYTLFTLSIALWVFSNSVAAFTDSGAVRVEAIEMTNGIGGFIAVLFLLFTYSYPVPQRLLSPVFLSLLFAPAVINLFVVIVDNVYIDSIEVQGARLLYENSTALAVFAVGFLLYWGFGIRNLVRSYLRADGIHRETLRFLLTGIFISSVVVILFDVLLPAFGTTFPGSSWLGSELSVVWLAYTSYILFRKVA